MPRETETFSVMEGKCDGYPIVAMISSRLQERKSKSIAPWFLSLSTPLVEKTSQGLPTSKEADDLNRWEDVIDHQLSLGCKFFFVGRVTWKGNRELLYYIDTPEPIVHEIEKLVKERAVRPFAFRYERDPDWSNVRVYM